MSTPGLRRNMIAPMWDSLGSEDAAIETIHERKAVEASSDDSTTSTLRRLMRCHNKPLINGNLCVHFVPKEVRDEEWIAITKQLCIPALLEAGSESIFAPVGLGKVGSSVTEEMSDGAPKTVRNLDATISRVTKREYPDASEQDQIRIAEAVEDVLMRCGRKGMKEHTKRELETIDPDIRSALEKASGKTFESKAELLETLTSICN